MKEDMKVIMSEIYELDEQMRQILCQAQYAMCDDLSALEYNDADPDELFMLDELRKIMSRMDDITHTLSYLRQPIKAEGTLHMNANGRYEVQGIELSSGCGIEYLATDDRHCRYDANNNYVPTAYWCSGRIEHNGTDYYIVGAAELETLENVRVRIRG